MIVRIKIKAPAMHWEIIPRRDMTSKMRRTRISKRKMRGFDTK